MTTAEYVMAIVPVVILLLRLFGPLIVAKWPAMDKPIRAAQRGTDIVGAYNVASGKWDPEVLARVAYEAHVVATSDDEALPWEALDTGKRAPWIASVSAVVTLKARP